MSRDAVAKGQGGAQIQAFAADRENTMAMRAATVVLLLLGLIIGSGGLALGAYLASGNNGWQSALWYSVIGLVAAPVSAVSWSSRRSKRRSAMAGVALVLGLLASMGLLLDLTSETSEITFAWSQVPLAVAAWLVVWMSWQAAALVRLIMFQPPKLRQRLSSRRGDNGR
jgi:FtsH-binding integral membrane protein